MSEREIMVTIEAIDARIDYARRVLLDSAEVVRSLYGARDALEIELRRVRALRPAL